MWTVTINIFNWYNTSVVHNSSTIQNWVIKFSSWRKMFQAIGKKKVKDLRGKKFYLVDPLCKDEEFYQSRPHDIGVVEALSQTKNEMRKLQTYRTQGERTRERENWINLGVKGSKFFFQFLKDKEDKESIKSIHEEGVVIKDHKCILNSFPSSIKAIDLRGN